MCCVLGTDAHVCFGSVLSFLLFPILLICPVFGNVPCIVVAVAEPVRVVDQHPGHPFLGRRSAWAMSRHGGDPDESESLAPNCVLSVQWPAMYEMDPVDVASSVAVEPRSKLARTDTGLSLKIKVSSILDQSSDREVIRCEELNFLRSRYRSLEGEDPMKSEEVTDAIR